MRQQWGCHRLTGIWAEDNDKGIIIRIPTYILNTVTEDRHMQLWAICAPLNYAARHPYNILKNIWMPWNIIILHTWETYTFTCMNIQKASYKSYMRKSVLWSVYVIQTWKHQEKNEYVNVKYWGRNLTCIWRDFTETEKMKRQMREREGKEAG